MNNFGDVIKALDSGKMVSRPCWADEFIFKQIPSAIAAETIPYMQTLPQAVKNEFARRGGAIKYQNQYGIVSADNTIRGFVFESKHWKITDWIILD